MRLIDVNEAREQMLKLLDHHLMMKNYAADDATQDCIEVLNEATVVDAVEVVHGHWFDVGSLSCRCSECGCKSRTETNYCPNCGAKMDEKEHEKNEFD